MPVAFLVLVVVGALTVAGQVARWVAPTAPPTVTPEVHSELSLTGLAATVATDYITWDEANREDRTGRLRPWHLPPSAADGWTGTGRLSVLDAAPTGIVRAVDRALVTLRVQVSDNFGSRWLQLAVPLAVQRDGLSVSAVPALVGSAPDAVFAPALASDADEDTELGSATAETVAKLLASYAQGDLEFTKAPGSNLQGLNGAATLGGVTSWRVAKASPGASEDNRSGDVTVRWDLPAGAGSLVCHYRIDLSRVSGRWLLAGVTPELEPTA